MNLDLTGEETGDQLVKKLVALRWIARGIVKNSQKARTLIADFKVKRDMAAPNSTDDIVSASVISALEENRLEMKFTQIEIGRYLMALCAHLDAKVSREAVFDAINTNQSDRETEEVRKYGDTSLNLICVLDLENSATKDDDIDTRPLKWCHTLAFMHELKTNQKLDRIVHDGANEFFGGVFGEFRECPLTERLIGQAA